MLGIRVGVKHAQYTHLVVSLIKSLPLFNIYQCLIRLRVSQTEKMTSFQL